MAMNGVGFLFVPYDSGFRSRRMGRGPEVIRESGVLSELEQGGIPVTAETILIDEDFTPEVETAFALMKAVSGKVDQIHQSGRLPIVCSGNCNITVGTYAGLGGAPAVLWLDAHSDFATDDDTRSGFLDGMGAAMLVGLGWKHLLAATPGYRQLDGGRLIQLGVRHYPDESVRQRLLARGALVITCDDCLSASAEAIAATILERCEPQGKLHLHLDVDVFDRRVCQANTYHPDGGIAPEFVRQVIRILAQENVITSMNIASYDPSVDEDQFVLSQIKLIINDISRILCL